MRFLLDTHVFIWWAVDDPRLSAQARVALADAGNTVYFSAASAWELALKVSLGKLALPDDPANLISKAMIEEGMETLPITLHHALGLARLPLHHRDPFDRMLVAQAQLEGLPILSADPAFAAYDVEVIW